MQNDSTHLPTSSSRPNQKQNQPCNTKDPAQTGSKTHIAKTNGGIL